MRLDEPLLLGSCHRINGARRGCRLCRDHVRAVHMPEQLRGMVERLVLLDGGGVAKREDGAATPLDHQMMVRLQRVHVLLRHQGITINAQSGCRDSALTIAVLRH